MTNPDMHLMSCASHIGVKTVSAAIDDEAEQWAITPTSSLCSCVDVCRTTTVRGILGNKGYIHNHRGGHIYSQRGGCDFVWV